MEKPPEDRVGEEPTLSNGNIRTVCDVPRFSGAVPKLVCTELEVYVVGCVENFLGSSIWVKKEKEKYQNLHTI